MKHTFAICAYGQSPYLEECIRSLRAQSAAGQIILVTSTPNTMIRSAAVRYRIPLYINYESSGITDDWNFAYEKADTQYVTIAHQDDVYFSSYARTFLKTAAKTPDLLMYFTDYAEIKDEDYEDRNTLLSVKRLMLAPFLLPGAKKSRRIRRMILAFGCPICCPSVTFNKALIPEPPFEAGYRSDEDWQAWEKLSKLSGSFVYQPYVQMSHRIHAESETSRLLNDEGRGGEDLSMFRRFWPEPAARLLAHLYRRSEKLNGTK